MDWQDPSQRVYTFTIGNHQNDASDDSPSENESLVASVAHDEPPKGSSSSSMLDSLLVGEKHSSDEDVSADASTIESVSDLQSLTPSQLQSLTPKQLHELRERRSSARSVKRKKFADETVEASLRPAYYRNRTGAEKMPGRGPLGNLPYLTPETSSSAGVRFCEFLPSSNVPPGSNLVKIQRIYRKKDSEVETNNHSKVCSRVEKEKVKTETPVFFYGGGYEGEMEEDEDGEKWVKRESMDSDDTPKIDLDAVAGAPKKKTLGDDLLSRKQCWTAMDDLKIITALQQLCDFDLVAKYVSFSTKLDAAALESRWNELLSNPESCRDSVDSLDKIPLDTIQRIRKMKFFTAVEEQAIKSILPGHATLDEFARLLVSHAHLFFPGRTPEDLLVSWKYLSQRIKTELGKPPPEQNPEIPPDMNLVRLKNRIGDIQSRASCFGTALINITNHLNFRSKHIGCEVAYLKALGERVGSSSLPDQQRPRFQRDHKMTLAFLCGVCVDYAIITDEVTFGYSNENVTVDIDLSLEGNIVNLQPLQGVIFLDTEGVFYIQNSGKAVISVGGTILVVGDQMALRDNCAVDIGTLTFQFYENRPAVKKHVEKVVLDFANRRRITQDSFEPETQLPQFSGSEDDLEESVRDENGLSGDLEEDSQLGESLENLQENGAHTVTMGDLENPLR